MAKRAAKPAATATHALQAALLVEHAQKRFWIVSASGKAAPHNTLFLEPDLRRHEPQDRSQGSAALPHKLSSNVFMRRLRRHTIVITISSRPHGRVDLDQAKQGVVTAKSCGAVPGVTTEAGHVQTHVGFRLSKEEAEKNALGWCSRIRFDLETCLNSDRLTGPNAASDGSDNSLHLKYMKAVKRVTGCD